MYLDANTFENVTFVNSVIHYNGGPVTLSEVHFLNGRFELHLTATPVSAPPKDLLRAILDPPKKTDVQVPR